MMSADVKLMRVMRCSGWEVMVPDLAGALALTGKRTPGPPCIGDGGTECSCGSSTMGNGTDTDMERLGCCCRRLAPASPPSSASSPSPISSVISPAAPAAARRAGRRAPPAAAAPAAPGRSPMRSCSSRSLGASNRSIMLSSSARPPRARPPAEVPAAPAEAPAAVLVLLGPAEAFLLPVLVFDLSRPKPAVGQGPYTMP